MITQQNLEYFFDFQSQVETLTLIPTKSIYYLRIVIYKAVCFDVAKGRMNGAPNETRTYSCRFARLTC